MLWPWITSFGAATLYCIRASSGPLLTFVVTIGALLLLWTGAVAANTHFVHHTALYPPVAMIWVAFLCLFALQSVAGLPFSVAAAPLEASDRVASFYQPSHGYWFPFKNTVLNGLLVYPALASLSFLSGSVTWLTVRKLWVWVGVCMVATLIADTHLTQLHGLFVLLVTVTCVWRSERLRLQALRAL